MIESGRLTLNFLSRSPIHRLVFGSLVAVLLLTSKSFAAEPPAIRIVVIGDSTAASYAKPPRDRPDLTGWGQVFGEFFQDQATIVNHARSGRSSKSFQAEGLWRKTLAARPDFVLIQFGHNDCPGKGDRSTDPQTDFKLYLRKYIDEARRINARPVLVTPMTRRNFQSGQIRSTLRPYAEAMIEVAKEKKAPVVDLHLASVQLFNQLGDAGSANLSASATDRTHFSREGARVIARLIVERLPAVEPRLKPYLRDSTLRDPTDE